MHLRSLKMPILISIYSNSMQNPVPIFFHTYIGLFRLNITVFEWDNCVSRSLTFIWSLLRNNDKWLNVWLSISRFVVITTKLILLYLFSFRLLCFYYEHIEGKKEFFSISLHSCVFLWLKHSLTYNKILTFRLDNDD